MKHNLVKLYHSINTTLYFNLIEKGRAVIHFTHFNHKMMSLCMYSYNCFFLNYKFSDNFNMKNMMLHHFYFRHYWNESSVSVESYWDLVY